MTKELKRFSNCLISVLKFSVFLLQIYLTFLYLMPLLFNTFNSLISFTFKSLTVGGPSTGADISEKFGHDQVPNFSVAQSKFSNCQHTL